METGRNLQLRPHEYQMKRRFFKSIYVCLVAFLWCAAVVVFMEGAALVYQLRMERSNPLIAAYRAGQPLPESDSSLDVNAVDIFLPEEVGGWDTRPVPSAIDTSLEQALAWGPLHSGGGEERQAHRAAFFNLSPDARELYARLRKEMILVFSPDKRIIKVYGSDKFFFEGIQYVLFRVAICSSGIVSAVYNALDTALKSGQPETFSLYWPNPVEPMAVLSASCIPAPGGGENGGNGCVFVSLNPDEITTGPAGQLPEDSRWVVPHYRFKPNYAGSTHPGFTTNSLGFRDVERAVPKPEGMFRIVCVGGSTTQEGATNESTFPALLEARLRNVFPGKEIEVVNAGVPGIATPLHLLRLPDYLALEPDLVILHLGVNDTLLKYNTWLVNSLPAHLRSARMFFPSIGAPSLETFQDFHREYMGRNLALISFLFQRRGAAVAFASIAWPHLETITAKERQYYNYQGQYTWEFPAFNLDTYAKYIKESNLVLQDAAAAVDGIYIPVAENLRGGVSLFTDFCHMTPAGIEAKTEILFKAIRPILEKRFQEIQRTG